MIVTTLVIFLTVLVSLALLLLLVDATRVEIQLDIIKIALATGAGAGGLVTLMMAVRRQLLAEQSAEEARRDANERRVIDLYSRGVDQFGSNQQEVRIGGLYALERLADSNPDLREQVVDIVCVLLQRNPNLDKAEDSIPKDVQRICLNFLLDHLAHQSPYNYHKNHWNVELMSLSGARLLSGYFAAVKVDTMHFSGTHFEGGADFSRANIRGANFTRAIFDGPATFTKASIGTGVFADAKFCGRTDFTNVTFGIYANFERSIFAEAPDFTGSRVKSSSIGRTTLPPGWKTAPAQDPEWLSIVRDPNVRTMRPRRGPFRPTRRNKHSHHL